MWEECSHFISTIGFPAVVTLILLIKIIPALNRLRVSVNALTIAVAKLGGVDYGKLMKLVGDSENGDKKNMFYKEGGLL